MVDIYLIIPKETIHEQKDLMPITCTINWSMNGVHKLSLEHAWFNSQKSVQTRMVIFFLFIGMGLDTHEMHAMGYIKPSFLRLLISILMAMSLEE
jgi:hypothetical protein